MPDEQPSQTRLGAMLDGQIAQAFNLQDNAVLIADDEHPVYRAGDVIVRQELDPTEANFFARLFNSLPAQGFRVPRPIKSTSGDYVVEGGWTAWTFLKGRSAMVDDAPQLVAAIAAYHAALARVPRSSIVLHEDSPFGRADRAAWDELAIPVHRRIAPLVAPLYMRLQPIEGLRSQLIHGDLNPDNMLVEPGLPPGIIDIAPYWRPAEFAQAVAAYWLGPYRGNSAVLDAFSGVRGFDQMLLRAGLRMLLISNEFGQTDDLSAFAMASEIICAWVDRGNR
jgi:uncharacterized protein (TIGR02569 family)